MLQRSFTSWLFKLQSVFNCHIFCVAYQTQFSIIANPKDLNFLTHRKKFLERHTLALHLYTFDTIIQKHKNNGVKKHQPKSIANK